MKLAAARALANATSEPSPEAILLSALDPTVAAKIAAATAAAYQSKS